MSRYPTACPVARVISSVTMFRRGVLVEIAPADDDGAVVASRDGVSAVMHWTNVAPRTEAACLVWGDAFVRSIP